MLNKNDPLINSVTKVMQENQVRRNVEQAINEAFGITSKNHLPFQAHAEYDALVEEMTQEALVGGQHKLDVNKNNRLDKNDFKMLRGMKKKPVEEEALDEISKKLAGKYTKAAANDLADKTDPNYGFMTDKDEDQVERETENRRKGIQRAVKTMMKEKAIKEERHKKVVRNILEKMRAKAGMEEEVVQERMTGLAPPVQSAIRKKEVANILKTPNPNTTAATGMQTTGAARIGPTGVKAVGAAPLSDAGKDAAVARMRQQRTDVRTGGAVGAAADAARPAPKPVATTPKPAAPARTIQGPAGTSATMTGRGTDAIVKTGGQTYKGSVVKNRFGGQSIQNFRAGSTPLVGPGKKN